MFLLPENSQKRYYHYTRILIYAKETKKMV